MDRSAITGNKMKKIVNIIEILAVVAIVIIVAILCGGCASLGKVGDGKLEPTTKKAVAIAATAAGIAAPEYAGAIDAAKEKIIGMGETQAVAVTEADIERIMRAAGYDYSYSCFFDGALIADKSRFSFEKRWFLKGTGATVDPAIMILGTPDAEPEAESEIDARIDAAMQRLAEKKRSK